MPSLLATARPPFLLLTPVCVGLGIAAAFWQQQALPGAVDFFWPALICLFAALAAHVAVNTFNEYVDFHSGLDHLTQRTPFSGGSGTLPAQPQLAGGTWWLAWASTAVTVLAGSYLLWWRGWALLPLGLLGLALVLGYSRWITRHPGLSLVAPGTGFGVLMVFGTAFALTGTVSAPALVLAAVVFFLVNNLLLLNQLPDIDADRQVGRRHLPMLWGPRAAALVYGVQALAALLVLALGVALTLLPPGLAWLGLWAPLPLVITLWVYRRQAAPVPALALNVLLTLGLPASAGALLWLARTA